MDDQLITDPIGWEDITLNLVRHSDYHSLIEDIQIPLGFYGISQAGDGGYAYLKAKRDNDIDAQVLFSVDVNFDGWEEFYRGQIDFTQMTEIEAKKIIQCTVTRNSLWAKFINRKAVPVDIRTTTNLDGGLVTAVPIQTQILPSQEIRQRFSASHNEDITYAVNGASVYGQIDFNTVVLDEVETKFNLSQVVTATRPEPLWSKKYAGDYAYAFEVFLTDASLNTQTANINVNFQVNDNAVVPANIQQLGINGVSGRTRFHYSATHALQRGDEVRIYIQNSSGAPNTVVMAGLSVQESLLTVTADTVFDQTEAQGFYINDVAHGIVQRIAGASFYSEYFGSPFTFPSYDQIGCGFDYKLFKGLHIRGYTVASKPFYKSFDEWWKGANGIFNLGLGYETIDGVEYIRCERKEEFYDDSSNSVTLQNVMDIEISIDTDYLFTSIQIGYDKWEAESGSGIDDPQTVHTYATRFKTLGANDTKNADVKSSFYAASLGIEQTRRESMEAGKDWRLDEETIIIQTNILSTPDFPRLYGAGSMTGLLNPSTRYNVRLTPASNFQRWIDYFAIAFKNYPTDVFRFTSGEGNVDMTFNNPGASGCDLEPGASADENANITVGTERLFTPILFKFGHPITWDQYKSIRANRKKSIEITYYNNDAELTSVLLFIKTLEFNPSKADGSGSTGKFACWLKGLSTVTASAELFSDVTPTYNVTFDNLVDSPIILSLSGDSDSESEDLDHQASVNASVTKTDNGGLAEDDGEIQWLKNGVLQHTQPFGTGGVLIALDYTFTSVTAGDILNVKIYEGVTP